MASRLVERLNQAILVLTRHPHGALHGSARGPKGGNLIEAISQASEYLTGFGGHAGAAGFKLEEVQLANFMQTIQSWYKDHPSPAPSLSIDGQVQPAWLNLDWLAWQNTMSPFGIGNPKPIWQLPSLKLTHIKPMGRDGSHARFTFSGEHEVVAFFVTDILETLKIGQNYELAVTLGSNTWRGETSAQWLLVDVRKGAE